MPATRPRPRHAARLLAPLAALTTLVAIAPGPASAVTTYPIDRLQRYAIPAAAGQVVLVESSAWKTSYATVETYERRGTGWVRTSSTPGRIGANGFVAGSTRQQDTGTTPAGMYWVRTAFGVQPNPGTRMPYTRVDSRYWWVEQKDSRYYNQLRLASQGGFRLSHADSEHLVDYPTQYQWAAVVDFNRPHPVPGRGAGIFLHVNGRGATAGCVSVPATVMRATMRWLDPAKHPVIVMGPASWLATR